MGITRKVQAESLTEFIGAAPDAGKRRPKTVKGVFRGEKRQITVTLRPELLKRVDEVARRVGQTRTGFINVCLSRAVEHGVAIDGLGRRSDLD